ncbi:hypothetical protein ACR9H8_06085 [Kosakonia cowanii]|nr:hypothetical protein [Enterobacter cloacae]
MATKQFSFWQLANLLVEGVGMMHGGFSVVVTVTETDTADGKDIRIAAIGRTNAAKAAGSGKVLFWCNVVNSIDNKKYVLSRKANEAWALGLDDIFIGDTSFFIPKDTYSVPSLKIECGYVYANYTGQSVPIPPSMNREINLTQFQR